MGYERKYVCSRYIWYVDCGSRSGSIYYSYSIAHFYDAKECYSNIIFSAFSYFFQYKL